MRHGPQPRPARPDYDAVVVGASAAGLRAAQLLAEEGREVLVLERREEIGDPGRTWIVTREIGRVLGSVPAPAVVHETDVMELVSSEERSRVRLDPPDLIVERSRLLSLLGERAARAGAEVCRGARVDALSVEGGRVRLAYRNGRGGSPRTVTARHLVGADGTRSWVAEEMGAEPQPTVPVVQAVVRLPDGHDPRVTRVWFRRGHTRFFYWLIPESGRRGVAGLIADGPEDARERLDGFLAEQGLAPEEYQGALIPLYRRGRRREWRRDGARVLLVGDAAGDVKVTTVGGVVTGLWGARAAARSLAAGTSYRRERRDLDRELAFHGLVRWVQNRFHDPHYDRLLRLLGPGLRHLLGTRNRDSMAEAAVSLLRAQPRLLSLGARALVSGLVGNGDGLRRESVAGASAG